jgi:hypothetical protein
VTQPEALVEVTGHVFSARQDRLPQPR